MSFFGFGKKDNLEDELFNLKFASKQLQKDSKKAEKAVNTEKEKVKKAMMAGNNDIAKVHASNAIMHKNSAINYLKMSSRIDAVAGKLGSAIKMQKVTGTMANITKTMGKVLKTMKLEDIEQTMEKFEQAFEDTDVMAASVTHAMESSTSMTTPPTEIEALMQEVADENELEFGAAMGNLGPGHKLASKPKPAAAEEEEDELMARLAKLKAPQ
jgi:charged multivesicular body protein 1